MNADSMGGSSPAWLFITAVLVCCVQIPLVIRETSRKYQLILAHKLVAQKRRNA